MTHWKVLGAVLLAVSVTAAAIASWPASPDSNLMICSRSGAQTMPKSCATLDGGCYIAWKDNTSGRYALYLQRVNASGVPLWTACGIVVDSNALDASLDNYSLAADWDDYAVIAASDFRAGGDEDVYAYRISPNGTFDWGLSGLTISDNIYSDLEPQALITTDGNIVIAWQEDIPAGSVIHLRKLSPNGADLWIPPVRTLTGTYGVSAPRLALAEDDAVFVQYLKHTGTQLTSPRHIYAQKFASEGDTLWADLGVVISTAGGISTAMIPGITFDDHGGAYSYWCDTRDSLHHVYAQHIRSDGSLAWTTNGVRLSLSSTEQEMYPSLTHIPGTGEIAVYYVTANLFHTQNGVSGQLLDSAGTRLWGANGFTVEGLDMRQCFNVRTLPQEGHYTVLYLENAGPTPDVTRLNAFSLHASGQPAWPIIAIMSGLDAPKSLMDATVNPFGQIIAAWRDHRTDPLGDVYLQNINPDGTLGDLTATRPSVSILFPEDSSTTETLPFYMMVFIENFELAPPPNGDGELEVRVNGIVDGWYTDNITAQANTLNPGMNTVTVELVTHDHQPLPHRAVDSIHVIYQSDAIESPAMEAPRAFALSAPHPNPFNPTTTLQFSLPFDADAALSLFDVLGREVLPLLSGRQSAGLHTVVVDASALPGGLYFCRLSAGRFTAVQKLVLMK